MCRAKMMLLNLNRLVQRFQQLSVFVLLLKIIT